MTAVPDEARRLIAAALEDHRVLTPPDESTPDGQAAAVVTYLISSGWAVTPAVPTTPGGDRCPPS